jgi:SAM-dependent methyltransferase
MPAPLDDARGTNRRAWEEVVPIHAVSKTYDLDRLVRDPSALSGVVAFDAPALGDLTALDVVHLQCHIGTDTVSLARLGGRVTGLDFSPSALATAADLAARCGVRVDLVEAELYDAPNVLPAHGFDLVYTGVGALCWLPDIGRWAQVVAGLLRPGGRLYLREGHPVMWALDDERGPGEYVLKYPYFERAQPDRMESEQTYTDGDYTLTERVTYEWNHGLGEVVTAVLDAGLVLDRLTEHRECEWRGLDEMAEVGGGRWALPADRADRVPLMYTLVAHAPA